MQNLNDESLAENRIRRYEHMPLSPLQQQIDKDWKEQLLTSGYIIYTEEKLDVLKGLRQEIPDWEEFKEARGLDFSEQAGATVRKWYTKRWWMAAAVSIGLLLGGLWYWYSTSRQTGKEPELLSLTPEQLAVKKATLFLANEEAIQLSPEQDRSLIRQGSMEVQLSTPGELLYRAGSSPSTADSGYNRIVTPRGGEYKLTLSDGTRIWLNAGSSVKYPVFFPAGRREVELTGEAYFEVAKDAAKPFVVKARNAGIRVLGTHFNVSAYDGEAVKATLVEGAVSVYGGRDTIELRPGQRAALLDHRIEVDKEVDTAEAIAWKNGYFIFNNVKLSEIMRRLERWYDVRVMYSEGIEDKKFIIGRISRTEKITKPLTILKMTGSLHFKIEGRNVYISK